MFDIVSTPPSAPLSSDAEAFATLLCGRVDCVTMSGAVSLVSIVTQQVSSWDLSTIANLGTVLDIRLKPTSISISVVQDTDVGSVEM